MVKSIYAGLKDFQELGGDLIARIGSMGVHDIFEPIITEFGAEGEKFNQVLFYLLNCYSRDSELHIQNTDWAEIKKKGAEQAGMDTTTTLYDDLFQLRNTNFTRTVRLYMDFQGNKALKHLLMLKDLYEQMVNAAIENIADKDGVVMYDQKIKNAEHADKLYERIGSWEQRIEQDEVVLNKAREQLRTVEKSNTFSLRMEDHLAERT